MAKIAMERHIGINVNGDVQDVGQWRIFDGPTLIGYLPYAEDSQILPIVGFNYDETDEIVTQCEAERARLGLPSKVIAPMTTLRDVLAALEELKEEESEDDSD